MAAALRKRPQTERDYGRALTSRLRCAEAAPRTTREALPWQPRSSLPAALAQWRPDSYLTFKEPQGEPTLVTFTVPVFQNYVEHLVRTANAANEDANWGIPG
jgi:hypothetical protein